MATTISNIADLPLEQVQQAQAYLTQLLQEAYPTLEFRHGAVHDMVLILNAALAAVTQQNVEQMRKSFSLADILADPNSIDPALIDRLASNFNVTRRTGQRAAGQIMFSLDRVVAAIRNPSKDIWMTI